MPLATNYSEGYEGSAGSWSPLHKGLNADWMVSTYAHDGPRNRRISQAVYFPKAGTDMDSYVRLNPRPFIYSCGTERRPCGYEGSLW